MIHLALLNLWLMMQVRQAVPADDGRLTAIEEVLNSGRVASVAESPSARVSTRRMVAPGMPPLLSFRYYEGRMHNRFGNKDLVLDDAGH
jgi:hypothetical protein